MNSGIIDVSDEHKRLAVTYAHVRHTCKTWADIGNPRYIDRSHCDWIAHFLASVSEIEVGNQLGLTPTLRLHLAGDGGMGDLKCGGVNIGVKATQYQDGVLVIPPDQTVEPDESFKDNIMFFCVTDSQGSAVEIKGWTTLPNYLKYREIRTLTRKMGPQWVLSQRCLYPISVFQEELKPKCHKCGEPYRMNYMDKFSLYQMTPSRIYTRK